MSVPASTDPDYRMPEADHAPPLSPEQIALLRRWVDEGAEWEERLANGFRASA